MSKRYDCVDGGYTGECGMVVDNNGMFIEHPEVTPYIATLVVTRHPGLVQYLVEKGLVPNGCTVVDHVTPELVKGMDVIGVLPLHLACHARSITEIPLTIPLELRGRELSVEQVRQYAGDPVTYFVKVW